MRPIADNGLLVPDTKAFKRAYGPDDCSIHQVIELLLKPANVALGAPEIRSQFLESALLLRVRHVGQLGKVRKLPLAVCPAILAPREGGPQLIDSRHQLASSRSQGRRFESEASIARNPGDDWSDDPAELPCFVVCKPPGFRQELR